MGFGLGINRFFCAAAVILLCATEARAGVTTAPSEFWIRPDGSKNAKPLWGIRGGIAVGLAPLSGPRGLIRIYAPYLDQPQGRMINFIAVEPVVDGVRGLSELEKSRLDGKQGLRMWSVDAVADGEMPGDSGLPARGIVGRERDTETLTLFVCVEPYKNGAHCAVEISFHSDRPHEVCLSTLGAADSRRMEACVLTATMGNFARLRHLQLPDRPVEAADLFRGKPKDASGFFDWHSWPLGDGKGETVSVSATGDTDELTPSSVPAGWRYVGRPAVQTWSTRAMQGLAVRVNGRETFWATHAAIPGGPAFENLELYAPFQQGEEFRFSVDELTGK